jgi:hypothetical protein
LKQSIPSLDISELIVPSSSSKLEYDPDELVPFVRPRIIASRLKFKLDYFNTTLNNDILFGGLDSYAGTKKEFEPSPLGLLIKGSIKDLLEDYIITGGVRFPTTFNGSEYFLCLTTARGGLIRMSSTKSTTGDEADGAIRCSYQYVTVLGLAKYSYPFDVYNSLRFTVTFAMTGRLHWQPILPRGEKNRRCSAYGTESSRFMTMSVNRYLSRGTRQILG